MRPRRHGWQDKAAPYKAWRYTWDHGAVHDVDQIEYRDGLPIAVLELTAATTGQIDEDLKEAVASRIWNQFSGRKLRRLAQALRVPMVIVLYTVCDDQVAAFSICDLKSEDSPWVDLSPGQYRQWLSSLPHTSGYTAAADTTTDTR